jgi:hypothetical protein
MLWQSSLLIGVVLGADLLLARKIRASIRHALWLVVLVKLLLPPSLALPTSAAWWLFPAKPVVKAAAPGTYVVTYALLQVIYWWHPLVWMTNARIRRVREEAVDDAVMLALADNADLYAPTLLEVAKLAFRRPLLSLGLVGIMESRSALRQRIERLVAFRAPRQAGLSLVSLLGIFTFGAVALPMGQGPAPAPNDAPVAPAPGSTPAVAAAGLPPPRQPAHAPAVLISSISNPVIGMLNEFDPQTLEARKGTEAKLNRIRLATVLFQGLPLSEVLRQLTEQSKLADPEKVGINFHITERIDPQTGLPITGADADTIDASEVLVLVNPQLLGSSLQNVLDAIVRGASRPIQYGIVADGSVVFFAENQAPLFARTFRVATNIFLPNLKRLAGLDDPQRTNSRTVPALLRSVFSDAGVDFESQGKSVFYNDGMDLVFVKATKEDIDTIEKIIVRLNQPARPSNAPGDQSMDKVPRTVPDRIATNTLIWTGPGRQVIMSKLDQIHLDRVSFDGLPLSEVLNQLGAQCRILDPEGKGINFLINNNPGHSSPPVAGPVPTGFGKFFPAPQGGPVAPNIDPNTGLPTTPGMQASQTEQQDVGSYVIKIPSLADVRLGDLLDAIVLEADHPLKYSVRDFAIVFSAKGPETPQLFTRTFRIDPNTFYSGLQSVSSYSLGVSSSDSVRNVGDVDAVGGQNNAGGLSYEMSQPSPSTANKLAKDYFTTLGVDLSNAPGKSVFFNDKGYLFVKATESDLDTIESALQKLHQVERPQIHIKVRFLEVPEGMLDPSGLGGILAPTNLPLAQNSPPVHITSILSNKDFQPVLKRLASRPGVETLAEPEVTMLSGRRVQLRQTGTITAVTNVLFRYDNAEVIDFVETNRVEVGPAADLVPRVLDDGYTIHLWAMPTLTEFLGYHRGPASSSHDPTLTEFAGVLPEFRRQQLTANVNLWDNQTLVLTGMRHSKNPKFRSPLPASGSLSPGATNTEAKEILVFITSTLVDRAGNRVHSDDELPFEARPPPQPK